MHTDGGDGQMESLGLSSWSKFTVVDEGDDVCFLLLSMFIQNYVLYLENTILQNKKY